MNLRVFITIIFLSSFFIMSAQRMAPILNKIKVLEYYKYENGAYHNYALVINTLDSDVTLTILKHHGWYYKPYPPNVLVSDGPYGIATADSIKWGKIVINSGDTLSYGIKLKAHEKKIIPDLFESIRKKSFYPPSNKVWVPKHIEIAVLANEDYAGNYDIKKITLPDSLPKYGIIYCMQINSGEPLPLLVHLSKTKFKPKKNYHFTIYRFTKHNMDTVEVNAMDTSYRLDKFFGLPCYPPLVLTVNISRESHVVFEERKVKDIMHIKLANDTSKIKVEIKTPKTMKISFIGIDFICLNPIWRSLQRVNILLPMNIQL